MSSNEDLRSILRHLRLITSPCPDLTTRGRLRWFADQIGRQIAIASAILTIVDDPENQSAGKKADRGATLRPIEPDLGPRAHVALSV